MVVSVGPSGDEVALVEGEGSTYHALTRPGTERAASLTSAF